VAKYQTGTTLDKPWFVGEAGCRSGNVSCTYNGNNATTVQIDGWWLDNLLLYGAKSVLIENSGTIGVNVGSLTQVGALVQAKNS
jgi:hypothetical protein